MTFFRSSRAESYLTFRSGKLRRSKSEVCLESLKGTSMKVYLECPVCLKGFKPMTNVVMTRCDHVGHLECMKKWVDYAKSCPTCSGELKVYEYCIVDTGRVVYHPPGLGSSFRIASLCGLAPRLVPLIGAPEEKMWGDETVSYVIAVICEVLGKALPSRIELTPGELSARMGDGWVLESGATLRDGVVSRRSGLTRKVGAVEPEVTMSLSW